jgi:hypothetical protein
MEVSALSHLTNSALVVYGLEFLKGTVWYRRLSQALPMAESKVHLLMSAIGAFMTAVGMHGAVSGDSLAGWQLTLAVPPLWILLHAAWDWSQQMALNQIVFALAVQQKAAAPVVTAQVTPKLSVTAAAEVLKP